MNPLLVSPTPSSSGITLYKEEQLDQIVEIVAIGCARTFAHSDKELFLDELSVSNLAAVVNQVLFRNLFEREQDLSRKPAGSWQFTIEGKEPNRKTTKSPM